MLAVEHVPEEHLVAGQGLPAGRGWGEVTRVLPDTRGGVRGALPALDLMRLTADGGLGFGGTEAVLCPGHQAPGSPPWTNGWGGALDAQQSKAGAEQTQTLSPGNPEEGLQKLPPEGSRRINAHLLIISDRGHLTT